MRWKNRIIIILVIIITIDIITIIINIIITIILINIIIIILMIILHCKARDIQFHLIFYLFQIYYERIAFTNNVHLINCKFGL